MQEQLNEISLRLSKEIFEAKSLQDVFNIKSKFLGKSGEISELLKGLKDVEPSLRGFLGAQINACKVEAEKIVIETEKSIKSREIEAKLMAEKIDVTLEKHFSHRGVLHPLTQDIRQLSEILVGMGFSQIDGPEIEEEKFNFELLNIPKGHPARDMQDTFYITDNILLRTQTSSTQARIMPVLKPPFKVFSPGRVFRQDEPDATHSPAFYQIEGLYVDEKVSMADLKNTLLTILKKLLGEKTKIRFRSSYFPFTEPSVEVDASCNICGGGGCASCKGQGWIEILGAGMVHPNVLEAGGIDSTKFSGFAFGLGLDRLTKLNYKIPDLRLLYGHDKRFLKQFN